MNLRLVSVKQFFVAALLVFFPMSSYALTYATQLGLYEGKAAAVNACVGAGGVYDTCNANPGAYTGAYCNYQYYQADGLGENGGVDTHIVCAGWIDICPTGTTADLTTGECISPNAPGTLTQGGWNYDSTPTAWDGGAWNGTVVDAEGVVWEPVNSSCDPVSGICISEWQATDQTVDPLDSSTWPPGSISSNNPNSPSVYGENGLPTEGDPFASPGTTPTADPIIQNDSSTNTDNTTGTTTETSTVETLSPDGDTSTTETTTTTNADGTIDQNVTVTHHDEQTGTTTTTTTTTHTNAQGVESVTISGSSTEKDKGNAASGGVDCIKPPICSGDKIQCALLYQQWKTRCDLNPNFTLDESGITVGSSTQFDAAIDGTGVDALIAGLGTATVIDAPAWGVDTILPSGSSGCSTISFSWAGSTVVFPSSSQCSKINVMKDMFGYFLYILTAMSIFQIATRRPA